MKNRKQKNRLKALENRTTKLSIRDQRSNISGFLMRINYKPKTIQDSDND